MRRHPATPFVLARVRLRRTERADILRHELLAFALISLPMLSFGYLAVFGNHQFASDDFVRSLQMIAFWPVVVAFCVGVLLVPRWLAQARGALSRLAETPRRRAHNSLERRMEEELLQDGATAASDPDAPLRAQIAAEWVAADAELALDEGRLLVAGGEGLPVCPSCGAGLERDSPTILRCGYCRYERVQPLAASPRIDGGSLRFRDHLSEVAPRWARWTKLALLAWLGHAALTVYGMTGGEERKSALVVGAILGFFGPCALGYIAHVALRAYADFGRTAAKRLSAIRAGIVNYVERQGVIAMADAAAGLGVSLADIRLAIASVRGLELPFHVHETSRLLLNAAYSSLEAECANCGDRRSAAQLEEPCPSCRFRPPMRVREALG